MEQSKSNGVEQKNRAEGRTIGRLIKCCSALLEHRGYSPTDAHAALSAALMHPRYIVVEKYVNKVVENTKAIEVPLMVNIERDLGIAFSKLREAVDNLCTDMSTDAPLPLQTAVVTFLPQVHEIPAVDSNVRRSSATQLFRLEDYARWSRRAYNEVEATQAVEDRFEHGHIRLVNGRWTYMDYDEEGSAED